MPNLSQRGIAPIVIILILAITTFTGFAVYKSSKQITIRQDKTTETTGGNLYPKTPSPETVKLANSGSLAVQAVKLSADKTTDEAPKFSIKPPSGWEQLPPSGQIVVEFLSPAKDTVEEDMLYFDIQPNITVFVAKGDFEDIDQANAAHSRQSKDKVNNSEKATINGQAALVTETTRDIADLLEDTLKSQMKQELGKTNNTVSEKKINQEIDELLKQAKIKIINYSFYKDGYYINVAGKSLESFWDKRGPQLKSSLDTFRFE